MQTGLTEQQKQQIAEKRRLALQKQQNANKSVPVSSNTATIFGKKINMDVPQVKFTNTKRAHGNVNLTTTVLTDKIEPQPPLAKKSFYGSESFPTNVTQRSFNANSSFNFQPRGSNFVASKFPGSSNVKNPNLVDQKFNNFTSGFSEEVNFVVTSETQFEVRSKYDAELVKAYKSMARKEYDPVTRQWRFPIEDYNTFFDKLKSLPLAERLTLRPLPTMVLKQFEICRKFEKIQEEKTIDWSKFPNSDELMDFQREGIKWVIGRNGRALIADEMGLGKTVQALMIAFNYEAEWPLLIVCPSSLRNTWADAIARWLPDISLERVSVVYTTKDIYSESRPKVLILSYTLVPKLKTELLKFKFKVAILDESHFIKSGKAARTKAVQEVVKSAQRLLLLSGTPMMSRPIEMFTQLQLLNKATFSNQTVYASRYCDAKQRPWGMDYNGSSNLDEFKVLLSFTGFIRRLKKDVLSQLPPKTRKIVTLDKSLIKNKEKSFSYLSKQLSNVETSKLMSGSNKQLLFDFFTASAFAKLPAVINYMDELFESGVEKLLLFAHHIEMLDGISDHLNSKNMDFIRIDGKTLAYDRQPLVDKFQEDPDCRVALLSIMAANTGLTLTAASVVVFAELYWNPGDLIQAEDRAYRIGQHCNLTVHYLIANKTVDDQIWPMIKNKMSIMKEAGLSNDTEAFKNAETSNQVYIPKDQSKIDFVAKKKISGKITNFMEPVVTTSRISKQSSDTVSGLMGEKFSEFEFLDDWDSSEKVIKDSNDVQVKEDDACWDNDVDDSLFQTQSLLPTQLTVRQSDALDKDATKIESDLTNGNDDFIPDEELELIFTGASDLEVQEDDDSQQISPVVGRKSNFT
ncbi:SWI/SNF-related matrix-associated actin-dependent regulator of chromatin subfamily A-like protein 1 [Symsagittifera roscoffensis]|uniref:SWI/SNF-related matrix-associated actin-dependent regulator of chromatin subfamily A-like protein 1 n=1 Tax=Symsagittifera roscoffensis TaxID=84072 RepID=UPI00307C7E75